MAIAAAARRLNELREAWPNPPDLVERVPEVVPGYPDRVVARSAKAAETLTGSGGRRADGAARRSREGQARVKRRRQAPKLSAGAYFGASFSGLRPSAPFGL